MPTLTIPDVPAAALARLRAAADRAGRTVEEEARDRLREPTDGADPPAEDGGPAVPAARYPPLRVPDRSKWKSEMGPLEHPEGLEPRRYPVEMTEERKRIVEAFERKRKTWRSIPTVPVDVLKRWGREGAEGEECETP